VTRRHDVVIVGAGPAGSAAAYYLATAGFDVLLLDKAEFPRDKTCGDGLTPRALAVLDDMGVLDTLQQHGYRVAELDMISPGGDSVTVPIPSPGHKHKYLLIVPRLILDDILRQRAIAAGAAFEGKVEVMDLRNAGSQVQVAGLQRSQAVTFQARLAVVATGASLKLLRRIGLMRHKPVMMVAARAYFEDLGEQDGHVQCHFDGVTLPGYGWVFPLSPSSANVGAGVIPAGLFRRPNPVHSHRAFSLFTQSPSLQKMMQTARQVGPLRGFPIRVDFDRSLTFGERVLLAGEAAGLANPLTGEGIDYALESGRIAAEHAAVMLSKDDLTRSRFASYDRELRGRFQRTIVGARRLGDLYMNPFLLDRMVKVARRNPDIGSLIGDVTVGNRGLDEMLSFKTLFRFALAV